jgi:ATP-dependent DNA helicase RecG
MKPPVIAAPETPLADIFRLTPPQKTALQKLGIVVVRDLLHYLPHRYSSIVDTHTINTLTPGESAVVYGRVVSAKTTRGFRTKIPRAEAVIEDGTARLKAIWFHQAFIAKKLIPGNPVKLSGKVSEKDGSFSMINPEVEPVTSVSIEQENSLFDTGEATGALYPIYPETKGITSKFLYHHIQKLFSGGVLDAIKDPIPQEILTRYNLPSLRTALIWIHTPEKESDAQSARKRFAFQEVFLIQLARHHERAQFKAHEGFIINPETTKLQSFVDRFPFTPTAGQTRALETILNDFKKGTPMGRLLEGDVGSGKTFVAAAAAYTVVTSAPKDNKFGNLQVAYMAPTEILAEQHFKSFIEYFRDLPIDIGLITGSGAKKFPSKVDPSGATAVSKAQLMKWSSEGKLPILIGTHALIQKNVAFKNLALAIVDEQHRFGTKQRGKLARKETILPHFLSMTATPIPRTLALTVYGNLDLTILDEVPAGRLPVRTELITDSKRKLMEDDIRIRIKEGRQVFIICPRIDEPDPTKELALNAKSVTEEARRLKEKVFPEHEIDILHGKMKPTEKERVMARFARGESHILVATSVVEVGVNVPNATTIVVEGAERFGLASLHQLRGRVMRSSHQPYCYLVPNTKSETSLTRLKALVSANNGFKLAELDLELRGSGELGGGKQWGLSDIGMEAIKNIKMVEAARTEVDKLLTEDPSLENHPLLQSYVEQQDKTVHWE